MSGYQRVLVVGAGAMGAQIAMVVALSGRQVTLTDTDQAALDRAETTLRRRIGDRVAKGRLSATDEKAAFDRLTVTLDRDAAAATADLVIEAVVERLEVKRELFAALGAACPAATVLASNSSSFVPSSMAEASGRPDRFCNLHFFNPALVMPCVEIVSGPDTAESVVDDAVAFVRAIGKEPVVLRKEIPGFVANRILNAVRDEAIRLYEGGYATVTDIDTACRTALGYPMGPFELMDLTGIDIGYYTKQARQAETGDPADGPSRSVTALVGAGQLGRKSGRGWYRYDDNGNRLGENSWT